MTEDDMPGLRSSLPDLIEDRLLVSNVIDEWRETKEGKGSMVQYYRPVEEIGEALRKATGNWPRVAGGMLFVAQKRPGGEGKIRYFAKTPSLFAWIQERCDMRWFNESCISPDSKTPRTPTTKDEFFNHLKDSSPMTYTGTSPLPHEPELPGVYYLPTPPVPGNPGETTYTGRLEEFVASLNPETEDDRDLLRALIVTLAWGGDAGTRPAFAICSAYGIGTGKSATAEAICEIFGGAITVNPKDDPEQVRARLLDDGGLEKRAIFMDNLKGRLSGGTLESMLTRKTIDGKRMYHGQFSRPNFLTWVLTSNSPKLSADMAARSVIAMLGKPKHEKAWVAWASTFIREHRWAIIHDCLVVLRGPVLSSVAPENRDRYQAWQDAVLSRCSTRANKLARLLAERRGHANADSEDAEEVAMAINEFVRDKKSMDPLKSVARITREEMHKLMVDKGIVGHDMTKKGVHTWISEMRGSPHLLGLGDCRTNTARLWVWNPSGLTDDGPIPL